MVYWCQYQHLEFLCWHWLHQAITWTNFALSREVFYGIQPRAVSQEVPLRWRHNDHDGGSNHHPHGCLLNRLFRRKSKKTSKLRVTGLCVGNSPGPVNSPHKGPVTRKMFPFDDVIMNLVRNMCSEITLFKLLPHLVGVDGLSKCFM